MSRLRKIQAITVVVWCVMAPGCERAPNPIKPPDAPVDHVPAPIVGPGSNSAMRLFPDDSPATSYLPTGQVKVGIYELRIPDRVVALGKRLKKAVAENSDWWREF